LQAKEADRMPHQPATPTYGKQIERAIKKGAKKIITESGLNPSTRTGSKALDHLVKQLISKQPEQAIATVPIATALGEALGRKIVGLSQEMGKTNLDQGVIWQLMIRRDLPSVPSQPEMATSPAPNVTASTPSAAKPVSPAPVPSNETSAKIKPAEAIVTAEPEDDEIDQADTLTNSESTAYAESIEDETETPEADSEDGIESIAEEPEEADVEPEPELTASESDAEATEDEDGEMDAEGEEIDSEEESEDLVTEGEEDEKEEEDEEESEALLAEESEKEEIESAASLAEDEVEDEELEETEAEDELSAGDDEELDEEDLTEELDQDGEPVEDEGSSVEKV
jgi:hypothetical protein